MSARDHSRKNTRIDGGRVRVAAHEQKEALKATLELGASVRISLCPDRVFINVLFLSIVDPHKRFDRFDDALPISNQIRINLSRREAIDEPSEEPRQVDYLTVSSAHRP